MASHDTAPEYHHEKPGGIGETEKGVIATSGEGYHVDEIINGGNPLKRELHGRHMQMIAIGEEGTSLFSDAQLT
jgi:amino acid permease